MGLDPRSLTLRQLLEMAEGKARASWSHTSAVLALLANCHRDPKKQPRPFRPEDFDPHADRDPATNRQAITKMRSLLTRKGNTHEPTCNDAVGRDQ